MPYLASPPDPPPVVVPHSEESLHLKSTSSQPSNLDSLEAVKTGLSSNPASSPSSASPTHLTSTVDFVKQGGKSQANLLLTPAVTADSQAAQQAGAHYEIYTGSSIAELADESSFQEKAIFPLKSRKKINNLEQVFQPESESPTYSISGLEGNLPGTSEGGLVSSLDQAIPLNGLPRNLTRSNLSVHTRSPGPITPFSNKPRFQTAQLPSGLPGLDQSSVQGSQPFELLPRDLTFPASDRPALNNTPPVFPLPSKFPDLTRQGESTPSQPQTSPNPRNSGASSKPINPEKPPQVVELTADRQDYDEQQQIFTAEGKVLMRYQGGLLDADRLQVNLNNRIAIAEGMWR